MTTATLEPARESREGLDDAAFAVWLAEAQRRELVVTRCAVLDQQLAVERLLDRCALRLGIGLPPLRALELLAEDVDVLRGRDWTGRRRVLAERLHRPRPAFRRAT